MDFQSKIKNFLGGLQQGASRLFQGAEQAVAPVAQQAVNFGSNLIQQLPQAGQAVSNPVNFLAQQAFQQPQVQQSIQSLMPQVNNFVQGQLNKPIAPWGPSLNQIRQGNQRLNNVMNGGKTGAEMFAQGMYDMSRPGELTDTGINAVTGFGMGTIKGSTKVNGITKSLATKGKAIAQKVLQAGKEPLGDIPQTVVNNLSNGLKTVLPQAEESLQAGNIPTKVSGLVQKGQELLNKVPNSSDPYFNTNKLNVTTQAKQLVNKTIDEVKPAIEKVVGKKLSNAEVIQQAEGSSKVLNSVVDRAKTAEFESALLKTRQKLAALSEGGTVNQDYLDTLVTLKSHATDIARKLQSFNIGADPKLVTSKQAILEAVMKVEGDSQKILEAAKGVNFDDYNQATEFYRKFVKPSIGEWADTLRYNSMLSSPNTHINNAFSNILNTGVVAPIEKTLTGAMDFLASKVTGKKQTQFALEGPAHVKGMLSSIGDASHRFANVMRGVSIPGNADTRSLPLATKGVKGAIFNTLNFPMKLLEASDQFFSGLTEGGEKASLNLRKARGVNVGNIETQASNNAAYRLFRSELNDPKQGVLLDGVDKLTGTIEQLRHSSNPIVSTISKYTLPFVRTPMNILKQGIEYSPAGIATLPGATNKTQQLSKAVLGSSAAAATAMLVSSGRTTWAEPTDAKKRAAFRAAGMQAYAVKIGDNWVAYNKLPPAIGFPIAMVSAVHDAKENSRIDDSGVDNILSAVAKIGNFFSDQSYMKNIGDIVAASQGSAENVSRFVSNYPQQLVPYRALAGWMARLTDPYQRKVNTDAGWVEQQVQQLFTNLPGLSQTVPTRDDAMGNPIPNQNKELNAFSPVKITTENPQGKNIFDSMMQKSKQTKQINDLKKSMLSGSNLSSSDFPSASLVSASEIGNPTQSPPELGQLPAGAKQVGDKILYMQDGEVKTISVSDLKQKKMDADYSLLSDRLTRTGDSESWVKVTDAYIQNLQDQQSKLNPTLEGDQITKLQNKIEDLQVKVNKYKSQGGFKAPKKGKTAKGVNFLKSTGVKTTTSKTVKSLLPKYNPSSFRTPLVKRRKTSPIAFKLGK